ncbi:MAG: S9 family peptidase, partial [Planctomycetota bacterium]
MRILPLLTLALFAATGLAADDLFSPADVARLRRVSSAAIAPDGNHVAYGLSVQRDPLKDKDGTAWTELHVVDREGHDRAFITGQVNIGGIQWTPDGRAIAYTAKRNGDKQTALYTIPIDGGESQKLFDHDTSISGVAF